MWEIFNDLEKELETLKRIERMEEFFHDQMMMILEKN